ncbi:MAG: hypothetical protein ISS26_05085 [Candidatus Omnitrophica bacterium]|nr:hypothetical protein [Candidatus Omnitrophota bacterium]
MAKALIDFISKLNHGFSILEKTRKRVEFLFSNGDLTRKEIEQIYGTLFLNAFIIFEDFLEETFFSLVTGKIDSPKVKPKIIIKNRKIAREIVFSGRGYVDWFPYEERTLKLANVFFKKGLPFTILDSKDSPVLKRLCYIRNALAHKSTYSLGLFHEKVLSSVPLTQREKYPTSFLRSYFRLSPAQTRYELYILEMMNVAIKLCKVKQVAF